MILHEWLGGEGPPPPPALARRIAELAAPFDASPGDAPQRYLMAAEAALRRLVQAGPATRASALDLLAIDALVTYAFEVATAEPDRLVPFAREAMVRLAAVRAS
ncbi:MAG TPA: hypothetical protein VF178_06825 [Gemmatimonadaceae bacterium]